jgi:hypothetical protein
MFNQGCEREVLSANMSLFSSFDEAKNFVGGSERKEKKRKQNNIGKKKKINYIQNTHPHHTM